MIQTPFGPIPNPRAGQPIQGGQPPAQATPFGTANPFGATAPFGANHPPADANPANQTITFLEIRLRRCSIQNQK